MFFRKFTQEKAQELGLVGFVMNRTDGTVYCEVEGEENAIEAFKEWLKEGSPYSRVDELKIETCSPSNFTTFEIRRTL